MPPAAASTMLFIGVRTAGSAIFRLFPRWVRELGRSEVTLEGVDLPLDAPPAAYRAVVERIRGDARILGALVTTHKIGLVSAARDLFQHLDPYAELCGEVSSISRRGGALWGHAKDPISSGLTLDAMLGAGYFGRTGGEALFLGAGGAATAIALGLLERRDAADRPARMIFVDRRAERVEALRQVMARAGGAAACECEYRCHGDARENDALVGALAPGSLVVNATGMGKNLPGSPLTDAVAFPPDAVAWDLNYRGDLLFLRQAQARGVRSEDGWLYFLHGWTQVMAEVLGVGIGEREFAKLAGIAAEIRTTG